MADLLEYILSETKNKCLSKSDALDFIRQYKTCFTFKRQLDMIHPLLHRNTSDLTEQRYSSIFTGQEFFLVDYAGHRVMPGVVCLEIAWAAVEQATGNCSGDSTRIYLKNVAWGQPIIVGDHPVWVHIGLFPEDHGEIGFEIFTSTHQLYPPQRIDEMETDPEIIMNCRGIAVFDAVATTPTLDLETLKARCSNKTLSAAKISKAFQTMGVNYNPVHQGIEMIYSGPDLVLAKVAIPDVMSDTINQFMLHPTIMDSALQAVTVLVTGSGDPRPVLPYSLQKLDIFGKVQSIMWVLIRYDEENKPGDRAQKIALDFGDETGTVRLRMKGLEIREMAEILNGASAETNIGGESHIEAQEAFELMTFEENWQEEALPEAGAGAAAGLKTRTIVCFLANPENQQVFKTVINSKRQETEIIFISQGGAYQKQSSRMYTINRNDQSSFQAAFQSIRAEIPGGEIDSILYLWALEDSSCITDYTSLVYLLQAVGSTQLKIGRILLAAQFDNGLNRCYGESWIGFERSLRLIMRNTQIAPIYQVVSKPIAKTVMKEWSQRLWRELQTSKAECVLYQDGKRHVYRIQPTVISTNKSPIQAGKTYLITGGCGGLGLLFAEHLAKTARVNLILTGRSVLDAGKQSKMKTLEDLGSQVIYIQADISDPVSMKDGLSRVKERFGNIHGVIHAAGVAGQQIIFNNGMQDFQKVLDPKVKGTENLDELLDQEPLDFVCYFSSSAAILGDFGSCDYSVANRFLMAYAHYRNQLQRPGKTVVINWPLWKDGGMGFVDDDNTRMYLKSSGQRILEAGEGLAIFDAILSQNRIQHLVIAGQPNRVSRFLGLNPAPSQPMSLPSVISTSMEDKISQIRGRKPEMKGLSLEQCLEWDIQAQISQILKILREKLDPDVNLADFGFDSKSLEELADLLSDHYLIEVTPALFFGFPTIEKLTRYYLAEHSKAIEEFYREDAVVTMADKKIPAATHKIPLAPALSQRRKAGRVRFLTETVDARVHDEAGEPIAVIGMSGRFPGALTVEELWNNLIQGKNYITEVPPGRWDWRDYYQNPLKDSNKTNSKWGGFIADIDQFDPLFFEISPREASLMDPKQRLFLEEAWHTLEDAGYMGERIHGRSCGVFAGVEESEYGILTGGNGAVNGNQNATLPARIAYKLDLKGPNLALTAACSSGLVAVHQACQALRQGDCEMALAGGISLFITPATHIGMSQMDLLSPDGESYVYDKRANGMVLSEAVAIVVLKPLSKAISDHDHIYGCIKASGVNYNGKGNGIAAPNPVSQAELFKDIYTKFHIDPEHIQFIIPHSVGSKIGDPIEVEALTNTFRKFTAKKQYCVLGSVKPLIGHTFAASGVVSLICMLMSLQKQTMFAMSSYESGNEYINFIDSPFIPNRETRNWETQNNRPRMGAVSTTGISGTNAHAVVEEYIFPAETIRNHSSSSGQIFVFSAKTTERLQTVVRQMLAFIQYRAGFSLADLAYTLQVGREPMEYRLAMVAGNRDELIRGLQEYLESVRAGREINSVIPTFSGTVGGDNTGVKNRHSRKLEQDAVQKSVSEKNLQQIAHYWTQGSKISWSELHEPNAARIISIPGYPFEKRHCWIETSPKLETGKPPEIAATSIETDISSIGEQVIALISDLLGLKPVEMNVDKPIEQYGFDSIIMLQLLHQLQTQFNSTIDVVGLRKCKTIQEIINIMQYLNQSKTAAVKQPKTQTAALTSFPQFPELIFFNPGVQGQPVFWFHGGTGGAEVYQTIAPMLQRPFYGIQARGYLTERVPLQGIQAMSAYYVQIIQSVQQEGPYDFGGLSIGGVVAYEVTRQLQELGQKVNSIVMLDAVYLPPIFPELSAEQIKESMEQAKYFYSYDFKNTAFQLMNIIMLAKAVQTPDRITEMLIHRNEVNLEDDDELFIQKLVAIANTRGLHKTETQISNLVRSIDRIRKATGVYYAEPLSDPHGVTCYFFRNNSGVSFGDLEDYYSTTSGRNLDNLNYWEEWEKQLPNLHMIDSNSPNHMMMLTEHTQSFVEISTFCKNLYSREGISADFLELFLKTYSSSKSTKDKK